MIATDKYSIVQNEVRCNLVLLYCPTRTGHFGPGSFISKLVPHLGESIRILIVRTDDKGAKEVSYRITAEMDVLTIPQPQNKMFVHAEDNPVQRRYARRLVDIMLPFLEGRENLVFWTNSADFVNVCEYIKSNFIGPKILYVHHAWSWKHLMNVSDEVFGNYWRMGRASINPKAFRLTEIQRRIADLADSVVVVTKQASEFMINVLGISESKITIILNGGKFPGNDASDKKAIRRKYGFVEGDRIVVFVGRVKKDKGVGLLINAFKLLCDKYENIKLLIVGDGDFGDYIPMTRPFWNRIIFSGALSADEVSDILRIAEIGVVPSMHEQCSFTAIEMRFHNLPVIVSDVDGLSECFEDGVDALKISVQYSDDGHRTFSEVELADKLSALFNDATLRAGIATRSYQKAIEVHSVAQMREQYIRLMESLGS